MHPRTKQLIEEKFNRSPYEVEEVRQLLSTLHPEASAKLTDVDLVVLWSEYSASLAAGWISPNESNVGSFIGMIDLNEDWEAAATWSP